MLQLAERFKGHKDKDFPIDSKIYFSAEFSLGPINHHPRTEKTAAEVWRTLYLPKTQV